MGKRCGIGLLAVFGLSATVGAARAGEEEIPVNKLPAAVKKAIKAKFPKAEIEEASREVEDGITTYEVKLEIDDRPVDVALNANGTILEIEKEIPFAKLPKAVKKALAAKYPKAKIEKVEEVTKGKDGPLRYEIAIQTEVVLTAKGKAVHEKAKAKKSKEKDEDEDEDDEEDEDHHRGDAKARKGEQHEHHGDAKAKKGDKDDDEDEDEERGHVKTKAGEQQERHAKAPAKPKKDKDEDEDDDEDD